MEASYRIFLWTLPLNLMETLSIPNSTINWKGHCNTNVNSELDKIWEVDLLVKKLMITSQVVAAALRQQAVRGRSNDRQPHQRCCHRMLSHSPIKLQVSLNTSITSHEHHYWSIFAVPYLWVAQAGWSLGIGWEGRWLPARTSSMSAPPFRFPPTRNMSFCPFAFCPFVFLPFCRKAVKKRAFIIK